MGLKKEEEKPVISSYRVYSDSELKVFHAKLMAKLDEIDAMPNTSPMEYTAWKLGYMRQVEEKKPDGSVYHKYMIAAGNGSGEVDYSKWKKFEDFWRQYLKYAERMKYAVTKEQQELEKLSEQQSVLQQIDADVKNF